MAQADVVRSEIAAEDKKDALLQHLFKCVVALPTRTPLFGTLVGLVSADSPTFSDDVVRRINDELTLAFQRYDCFGIT